MELKTFDEFKNSDELKEATIGQWAKNSAAIGAAVGGFVGMASASIAAAPGTAGLSIALPLAAWAGISMGLNGLIGGVLFAGGQARKDFKELKKTMRKLNKYQSIPEDKITDKTVNVFTRDLNRALFLVRKLRGSLDSDVDIATSKGLLRSDIKQSDEYLMELEHIESELARILDVLSKNK
ncbi:hypothetical protein VH12019_00004 [Vibrio phage VH1_2019]|uniref:Uncharacterized protein n=1 Tax=Vibrio phage VH1_2019 TaxID=2686307 RepID=A0A6B9SU45_9CAUD|nr:hypothetical protein VH12019_00004 [Vibrio phage VH1_2019]